MVSVYVDSVRDVEILATENITAEQRNVANYTRRRSAESPSSSEEEFIQPNTNTLDGSVVSQSNAHTEPPKGNQLHENTSVEGPARTRNNFTAGVVGEPLQLQNIGPVNRALILKQLISKTAEKYEERYASILDTDDMGAILEQHLNPTVRDICKNGEFTLSKYIARFFTLSGIFLMKGNSLIAIGQNPENLVICGVYLHILWRRSNPQKFWLYVGQAAELRERIRTHNDIYRRKRNPSLHYHVWDSAEDMDSVFVTLGASEKPTSAKTQLLLNLLEMWMALVFQTLTSLHLNEYLPESVNSLWSGHHLNVALPLWQGFTEENQAVSEAVGGRISFQQYFLRTRQFVNGQKVQETRLTIYETLPTLC
ncbi:hypothetical protein BDV38DRAFT_282164 [Aspergillus pseudotamarii]|uniref:Uncharacterized protein n=1 Tax=Aspergillus pseudotamarii TaxID=132259 RepID=A0A5N6SXI4_ASPPS|nr:uncharacterized protein BDV38DRAFT_282164 [Aspergillus pseudotamarii]KAE8138501.1 hypothetical protein BDV38DRAFT_282164 [Aspergillus pseudotamarii]